jgi:hypothetical protein
MPPARPAVIIPGIQGSMLQNFYGEVSRLADIPLCSSLWVCSSPRSLLPQGS